MEMKTKRKMKMKMKGLERTPLKEKRTPLPSSVLKYTNQSRRNNKVWSYLFFTLCGFFLWGLKESNKTRNNPIDRLREEKKAPFLGLLVYSLGPSLIFLAQYCVLLLPPLLLLVAKAYFPGAANILVLYAMVGVSSGGPPTCLGSRMITR